MDERVKSASEMWLEARAPGFKDLPEDDRREIFAFAILWSLFEAVIMGTNANARRITEKLDTWAGNHTLDADLYDAELAYFRGRYFANGQLSCYYPHLNLPNSYIAELVKGVIQGTRNDPHDRMLALLMIVYRLRNNLFHGEKWAYEIRGQRENFTHANVVLMRVLDRHGQLA